MVVVYLCVCVKGILNYRVLCTSLFVVDRLHGCHLEREVSPEDLGSKSSGPSSWRCLVEVAETQAASLKEVQPWGWA